MSRLVLFSVWFSLSALVVAVAFIGFSSSIAGF